MATLMAAILGAVVGGVMWATFGLEEYRMLCPHGANGTEGGAMFAYLVCLPTGAAAGAGLGAACVLAQRGRCREAGVACFLPTMLICPLPALILLFTLAGLMDGQGGFGAGVVALLPSIVAVSVGIALRGSRPAPVRRRLSIRRWPR